MADRPATLDERARDRRRDRARRRGIARRRACGATAGAGKRQQRGEVLHALAGGRREVLGREARHDDQLLARPCDRDVEPALAAALRQRAEVQRAHAVGTGPVADRNDDDVALVALDRLEALDDHRLAALGRRLPGYERRLPGYERRLPGYERGLLEEPIELG